MIIMWRWLSYSGVHWSIMLLKLYHILFCKGKRLRFYGWEKKIFIWNEADWTLRNVFYTPFFVESSVAPVVVKVVYKHVRRKAVSPWLGMQRSTNLALSFLSSFIFVPYDVLSDHVYFRLNSPCLILWWYISNRMRISLLRVTNGHKLQICIYESLWTQETLNYLTGCWFGCPVL